MRLRFLPNSLHFEVKPFSLLETVNDLEQVASLWIAVWTEHAHQALGRLLSQPTELLKPDRGVDVVAQDRLAGIHIP